MGNSKSQRKINKDGFLHQQKPESAIATDK